MSSLSAKAFVDPAEVDARDDWFLLRRLVSAEARVRLHGHGRRGEVGRDADAGGHPEETARDARRSQHPLTEVRRVAMGGNVGSNGADRGKDVTDNRVGGDPGGAKRPPQLGRCVRRDGASRGSTSRETAWPGGRTSAATLFTAERRLRFARFPDAPARAIGTDCAASPRPLRRPPLPARRAGPAPRGPGTVPLTARRHRLLTRKVVS